MHDLRYAFRMLKASPVVSVVAILSLALGIGANTAIFSILDSLMLRSLPVKDPQQLAVVTNPTVPNAAWTYPIWEQLRERQSLVDGAFAWSATRFNLAQGGPSELVDGLWASGRYFDVLGVPAVLGRTLTEADDRRGGGPDGPVAVIGYSFWQRRYGGAADVIGRSIVVERVPFTIVGVTPPAFFGVDVGRTFDVAIPFGVEPLIRGKESSLDRRSSWWLYVMIRTKPDQTIEAAAAALRGVQPQIREATIPPQYLEQDKAEYLKGPFTLRPASTGSSPLRQRYERPLLTIMVVVGLVLLIACANIANLMLARATARRHELSVRLALGASRRQVARQLLVESLVLSVCGALAGLAFARWGSRVLVRQLSTSTTNVFLDLAIDWRVLAFTASIAIATAILFGTAPALRATRVQPNEALKERGRGPAAEGRLGLGNVLVVVQVALSLLLVVAAGLFVRTFATLSNRDLGFEPRPILVANVNAQRLQLEPAQRPALFERLRQSAAALPGVKSVALSAVTPVSGSSWSYAIEQVDGVPPTGQPGARNSSFVNIISGGWFATYGTPFISGRDFAATDSATAPRVAIVNETFARRFLGGQNPLGRRVKLEGSAAAPGIEFVIVGYVRDAVYRSLREPVPPTLYVHLLQHDQPPSSLALSLRAAGGSPIALTKSAASALTGVNRDIAITFRALDEQVGAALVQERMVAMLSGFFGGLALLLAGLGLYGLTSYAVSRRRAEIGIRMALGARPGTVVQMVLRRVAILVAAGVIVGGAISLWLSRFVGTLLYQLEPRDPTTLVIAALVLATIGGLAGWLPARRASRIDPALVLRDS